MKDEAADDTITSSRLPLNGIVMVTQWDLWRSPCGHQHKTGSCWHHQAAAPNLKLPTLGTCS